MLRWEAYGTFEKSVSSMAKKKDCEGRLSTKKMSVNLCGAFNGRPRGLLLFNRKERAMEEFPFIH